MVEDTQAILCPGCGKVMARHREGDLVRDECGTCRGVFLDRGELNALVTAISGDMEWNTATGEQAVDTAPERMCPRCLEGPMQKRPFLSYLGVVLDVCPACGGVYPCGMVAGASDGV